MLIDYIYQKALHTTHHGNRDWLEVDLLSEICKLDLNSLNKVMRLKELTFFAAIFFVACNKPQPHGDKALALSDTLQTLEFPILIDGGKKVVYQFSKMTPRGPRYFLDTVEYAPGLDLGGLVSNSLFPLQLSESQRNEAPGIIAISLPGYFEETIFGLIDERDRLRINYKGTEMALPALRKINFKNSVFETTFQSDALNIQLTALLGQTATGTHRAGKGKLIISENARVIQESEIFLVCN
jgi:hypothetical protein